MQTDGMKSWRPSIGVVCALCVSLLAGCSATQSTGSVRTPQATARAYYEAVGSHRWNDAAALLAPTQLQTFTHDPGSDRNNTLSLSKIDVLMAHRAPFDDARYPGYIDVWQVLANYDAVYRKVFGTASGPQTQFVELGHATGSSSWRILSFGSGP